MQNMYSFEQFQKLNEVLLNTKEELKNFDNQNSFTSRSQLRRTISRLTNDLCLRNSSPHIRRLYNNWNVLNEYGCTKQDLSFVIETLNGIKKSFLQIIMTKSLLATQKKTKKSQVS